MYLYSIYYSIVNNDKPFKNLRSVGDGDVHLDK